MTGDQATLNGRDTDPEVGDCGSCRLARRVRPTPSPDVAFWQVDLVAINLDPGPVTHTTQTTAAHGAGPMFGLGDEYVEEAPTGNTC